MKTWFACKVKYPKQDEQGRVKDVTEAYLADALSFTEAEAKIYEEMGQRVMGEFQVMSITKSKIIDIFEFEDADVFYQAKVVYMVADADSGKEKKVTNLMLVGAHHIKEAYERIHSSLNNMLVTFTVPEIKESPILEIFHHLAEGEEKIPDNLVPVAEYEQQQQEEEEQEPARKMPVIEAPVAEEAEATEEDTEVEENEEV
ncbi:MAG: DUF4494 domain-containing protein [Roseivirga sp.]|nr:DUF4494 domain-containing protein [Roseivirga sp.]